MSVFNQISEPQETYTLDQFISLKDSDKDISKIFNNGKVFNSSWISIYNR